MKKVQKIVALMVSALLLLSSVSSVAESQQEDIKPCTININLDVNTDAVSELSGLPDEGSLKAMQSVVDLINKLNLQITTDGVDTEFAMKYEDKDLINGAVLKDNNCINILSNLFPNYMLKVDINKSQEAIGQKKIDPQKIAEPLMKAYEDMLSKTSKKESVNITYFDKEFTSKKTVDMTTKELLLLYFGSIKEILNSDQVKELINAMKKSGFEVNISDIEETVEKIKNTNDEDLPATEVSVYENEDNDKIVCVQVKKDNQLANMNIGTIQDIFVAEGNISENMKFNIKITKNNADLNIEMKQEDNKIYTINASVKDQDKKTDAIINILFNDKELAKINIVEENISKLAGMFNTEEKKEINANELNNIDSETTKMFFNDLQTSGMQILSTLIQAVPELAEMMQTMN